MHRKFLTNLILLLFLNLLIKPFWIFGIDREVQNVVGSESYGFYFVILNFSFLFNILLDIGITNFNNRNIAQNSQLLNKHFSSILIMKLVLGVFYTLVTFTIALIWWGADPEKLYLLGFLAFNQFLLSFILYLRSNVSGLLMFRTDSVLSVLDRLLMILICGFLLYSDSTREEFKIEWFVYAQTSAYSLTALIALVIVMFKASFKKLNWNWPFFVMIVKQSFPFALLVLLMTFYNRIDTILLAKVLPASIGNEQAGIYAHGYRLLDAVNMIAFLFSVLLLPLFSKMIKQKLDVVPLVKLAFSMLITISVITAIAAYTFRVEIMSLLYDEDISRSARVFGLLMFGYIAISTTYVFGTLLTANGNLKQLNIVAGSGMLISIVLNLVLIPELLAYGSAIASVTAQFATAFVQVLLAVKIFKMKTNRAFLIKLSLFILLVVVMGCVANSLPFDWITSLALYIGVSLILSFALGLLDVISFIRIIKSK